MKSIIASLASLTFLVSATAFAQDKHDDHQPQHGGVVTEAKGIHYELVASPDSLVIYVDDHGKQVDTKGASGKVTLLNGGEKTEAALTPAGGNKLEAKGSFKVDKGTKAVAVVTLPGKSAQSVRFSMK